MLGGSTSTVDAGGNYPPSLPTYRRGASDVRQNRATIEALASDQVSGILLAAAIANQSNTYQRPFGLGLLEWGQTFFDSDPSVGVGQMRIGEAEGLGYKGTVQGLLDDSTSIQYMSLKLQNTTSALSEFDLDPTESFMLLAIGNNIGNTVAGRYKPIKDQKGDVQTLLQNDLESRTQLLKMMNWMGYLYANDGWAFPADVDTGRVWHMLQNAYRQ